MSNSRTARANHNWRAKAEHLAPRGSVCLTEISHGQLRQCLRESLLSAWDEHSRVSTTGSMCSDLLYPKWAFSLPANWTDRSRPEPTGTPCLQLTRDRPCREPEEGDRGRSNPVINDSFKKVFEKETLFFSTWTTAPPITFLYWTQKC